MEASLHLPVPKEVDPYGKDLGRGRHEEQRQALIDCHIRGDHVYCRAGQGIDKEIHEHPVKCNCD